MSMEEIIQIARSFDVDDLIKSMRTLPEKLDVANAKAGDSIYFIDDRGIPRYGVVNMVGHREMKWSIRTYVRDYDTDSLYNHFNIITNKVYDDRHYPAAFIKLLRSKQQLLVYRQNNDNSPLMPLMENVLILNNIEIVNGTHISGDIIKQDEHTRQLVSERYETTMLHALASWLILLDMKYTDYVIESDDIDIRKCSGLFDKCINIQSKVDEIIRRIQNDVPTSCDVQVYKDIIDHLCTNSTSQERLQTDTISWLQSIIPDSENKTERIVLSNLLEIYNRVAFVCLEDSIQLDVWNYINAAVAFVLFTEAQQVYHNMIKINRALSRKLIDLGRLRLDRLRQYDIDTDIRHSRIAAILDTTEYVVEEITKAATEARAKAEAEAEEAEARAKAEAEAEEAEARAKAEADEAEARAKAEAEEPEAEEPEAEEPEAEESEAEEQEAEELESDDDYLSRADHGQDTRNPRLLMTFGHYLNFIETLSSNILRNSLAQHGISLQSGHNYDNEFKFVVFNAMQYFRYRRVT